MFAQVPPEPTPHPVPLELGAADVHVWHVSPPDVSGPDRIAACRTVLSEEEQARSARFVFETDRHHFLVSHALVRLVLSRYALVHPEAWTFRPTAHGRPLIAGPPTVDAFLHFSLSHTPGLAAVAIARKPDVGIDVEALARRPVDLDVAHRHFAASEIAALLREAEPDRQRVFLEFWTLKEAYIKARGLGLALPLDKFAFERRPGRPVAIVIDAELADDPGAWWFAQPAASPGHLMAVAVRLDQSAPVSVSLRDATGLF
jgi:4'-phosphopantetheinyl transferase